MISIKNIQRVSIILLREPQRGRLKLTRHNRGFLRPNVVEIIMRSVLVWVRHNTTFNKTHYHQEAGDHLMVFVYTAILTTRARCSVIIVAYRAMSEDHPIINYRRTNLHFVHFRKTQANENRRKINSIWTVIIVVAEGT